MGLDTLFENQLGYLSNFQKLHSVAHILPFYPRGGYGAYFLFSLYEQWFLGYGPIFKIVIFGHETWQLEVPEVAHILPFYPHGVEIELIFALRAVVSEIWSDF